MTVEKTNLNSTKIRLTIKASSDDLEPIKRHVLAHFRHSVKIPGFRAGTAPMALIEKNVDQKAFLDEFLEHALNQLYTKTIEQEKLRTVGQPNVQLKKFVPFSDLELEIETNIIGQVTLADYKKVKIAKEAVNVTAKDVHEILKSLQDRSAERRVVERAAKKDDEVIIDFKGMDEGGKPVTGAESKDYPLILGSGNFIPGFEDNLVGLKKGQNKKFDLIFPRDYSMAALQNKKVTFDVEVKKVNELAIPKADDALAASIGPFKSLSELKADIKKQLKLEREQQAENDLANKIVGDIIEKSKVDIPADMVEEEITRIEDEEKRNLTTQGKTWQEHLKEEGINEDQHRDRQRPEAEKRIKGGIVLGEISDREGINVSPSEVEERIQLHKGQFQDAQMQSQLDTPQARRDIEGRLLTEKTINKLIQFNKN